MASPPLLSQADEDALHSSRLYGVEDKLYKRLKARLLSSDAPYASPPQAPPTPPPDAPAVDELALEHENKVQIQTVAIQRWRDDALLDFAAWESNLERVQLLLRSNDLERERYAHEKERIVETAQSVKANNVRLHQQLDEARQTLALRQTYDVLAEDITKNAALKPRAELGEAIEQLNAEIADLEREHSDHDKTWSDRREQFGRMVDEGKVLLRMIRDEKEEAERPDEMDEIEGESRPSTPKLAEEGGSQAINKVKRSLKVGDASGAASTPGTSRAPSPNPAQTEDIRMEDTAESLEDGEEAEQKAGLPHDRMDLG